MTLKYIFAKPDYVENVGDVYPILLKDYDRFQEVSKILYISKKHFVETELPLLVLIQFNAQHLGFEDQELYLSLEELFSIVMRDEVKFHIEPNSKTIYFLSKDGGIIDFSNYDIVRSIIMRQNLIFEQKVYKNPKMQEWANKILETRQKNSSNISIEDIISTVSVLKGVNYSELQNYSLYQLYADFYRARKIKKYETDVVFKSVDTSWSIEDFAEDLDLFKNPYDDLFVDKGKLSKLDKALKS